MPSGKKRKRHKMSTHKRKKRLRKIDIKRKNKSIPHSVKNGRIREQAYKFMNFKFVLCVFISLNLVEVFIGKIPK